MKESMLFRSRWPASSLADDIASMDVECLMEEFVEFERTAPCRSTRNKPYFVGHKGVPGSTGQSNRVEEHLAIALCNLDRRWPRADGGWFQLLDYQVPLKARQSDKGVGKIDLLGVTDQGRLVIHELKVKGKGNSRGQAPPAALMEGLRYAAWVQADIDAIAEQAQREFRIEVSNDKPIVQIVAPIAWWDAWFDLTVAGAWVPALADISDRLTELIGVPIEYGKLENVDIELSKDGVPPQFLRNPRFSEVELG